jgi:hypothetical protein
MSSVLTNVKSTYSYTAEFLGSTYDPCYTKGLLESSPSIHYTGNSLFFNYSQTKNVNDLKFLKLFFNNLTVGSTFSYSSGEYVNSETGEIKYWNGQLQYQGCTGIYNEFIYCSGITNITGISFGLYNRNLFNKPIQFSKISGSTANILISKTPDSTPLNFMYLGLYGTDYSFEEFVEVEGSILNNKRIKVKNCLKLNDETEVIYLDPTDTIVNENFYFQKKFINVYMRGQLNINSINSDETVNGVIYMYHKTEPGIYSHLLENQNKKQFNLISTPDNSNIAKTWYPNTTIKNFNPAYTISDPGYSFQFAKIYHVVYASETVFTLTSSAAYSSPVYAVETIANNLYIDNQKTNIISYQVSTDLTAFKIDLSDSRNLNLQISAFTNPEFTTPLTENYVLYGTPGTLGACFVYYNDTTETNQSIYLKFEKETTTTLTIIIS